VVEDAANVRELIVSHLREAGYPVLEASSGEEAIDLLRGPNLPPIGVLFTDIQLGGSATGWEVAEVFRDMQPETAVIYTSGQGQDQTRQVAESSFLPKPYLPSDIVELIELRAA